MAPPRYVVTVVRLSACLIVKNEAAVLERCGGSVTAAARAFGMQRSNLSRTLRRLGVR